MPNLALLAIPAYTVLSLLPHVYAFRLASASSAGHTNSNPHGSSHLEALKKSLGGQFEKYERAESAHRNNLENAPLFFATLLATVLAEKAVASSATSVLGGSGEVGLGSATFAATFLALRVVYNFLYVQTESEQFSHVRSMTFTATIALQFWQIWKSAVALA